MRVIDLALKDLTQVLKDRKTFLFLVAMPILFTLFFALLFGAQGRDRDPRLPVGVADPNPNSPASLRLMGLLEASDSIRPVRLDQKQAAKADELVRDGKMAAALILPQGFDLTDLGAGGSRPTLIVDATSSAGQTVANAVDAVVGRLLAAAQTSQLSLQAFETQARFDSEADRAAYQEEAQSLTIAAWRNPALALAVELSGAAEDSSNSVQNSFNQGSAGTMVQFTIYGLISSAMVLVLERKSGAMQRLLTTTVSRAGILAGHSLAMLVIVLGQQGILMLFGQLAFHVPYARQPLAIGLVALAYGLWVVSLGMLIGAVSRSEDQVIVWSLLAMFLFSAMGGAWFALEYTGKTFAAIGHWMPTAWAMDGFQNALQRGLGLSAALLPAGVLLAYAVLFYAVALWRFRFE